MTDSSDKKQFVNGIQNQIEASRNTPVWQDFVNALKLISQVIFTRSTGFILELLQNAEDSGRDVPYAGYFKVTLNKDRMTICHNGRPFSENDVRAICGIRSSKKPEQGTLGYLGIGFKSIFKATDCPEVYSNGYQFKFDRNHSGWKDPSNTPWHIMPLWIDTPSVKIDPALTSFVIPFRDPIYYSAMLREIKELRTELYLFLRWIKRIEIRDEPSNSHWVLEDGGESIEGITTLKHDSAVHRFRIFRKVVDVPKSVSDDRLTQEYRANVKTREIAIAFALDAAGNLDPAEAGAMYGGVYSFLPLAESSSGAKFPIQADFLVQPGRDAINYESPWNKWILEEVTRLCKEAITVFKDHSIWKYQFLPAFEFIKSKDLESYQKLFGPSLIEPLDNFLTNHPCIPTSEDGWAMPDKAVKLKESAESIAAMGVLAPNEIAPAFGGSSDLQLAHHNFRDKQHEPIKTVDRSHLLDNEEFLAAKASGPDAADWFRRLYLWLHSKPVTQKYGRTYVTQGYHSRDIILTSVEKLASGGKVYLIDVDPTETLLTEIAATLGATRSILHPAVLAGATDDERKKLRGFLTSLTGVQLLDGKAICKDALLPKILTTSPAPTKDDLLQYTRYCRKVLRTDLGVGAELWVLTKTGEVRMAREVFLGKEFKPIKDWETNGKYVPGISFVSTDYLEGGETDAQLQEIRAFFQTGRIHESPNNGIEDFAINYALEKLHTTAASVAIVEKLNLGYDLEVVHHDGTKMYVEVKGKSSEEDVELTGNETDSADKHKEDYFLLVVANIPEHPGAYLVSNPASPGVGKKDKLTIEAKTWKGYPM